MHMKYSRYQNAKEFYNDVYDILLKHEEQNSLPLGNVILGNQGGELTGWRNPENWFMASVRDECGKIILSAIMTPPFNITMYETDNIPNDDALHCLCNNIINENIEIPGVTSENTLAERFAKIYTQKKEMGYKTRKNLRIYSLREVNKSVPLIGKIRKAGEKDMPFLPYWHYGFSDDCSLEFRSFEDSVANIERAIKKGMLYVLEDDGMPVSIASALRESVHGRTIGMVYTPPYFRKKGYASACVAELSQIVLDMGYEYVSLFTDISNPISNSIYQKIGYKPVCDYNELEFIVS